MASAKDRLVESFRRLDPEGTGSLPRPLFEDVMREVCQASPACLECLDFWLARMDGGEVRYEDFFEWLYGPPRHPTTGTTATTTAPKDDAAGACRQQFAPDPRWNSLEFNDWCDQAQIAWVYVRFLRRLLRDGALIPSRGKCPQEELHIGAPPDKSQLYCVSWSRIGTDHPDPDGFHLRNLVRILSQDCAFEDDLVLMNWTAVFTKSAGGGYSERPEQTRIAEQGWDRAFLHFRLKAIILAEMPGDTDKQFFDSGWAMYEFALSSYTQRIVNQDDKIVKAHLTPEWLMNTSQMLRATAKWRSPKHLERAILQRQELARAMTPAKNDAVGFQTICSKAGFRWIFVSYIFECAARGGPVPRCQDLPPSSFRTGVLPPGCQPWVVSYSWSAHMHPCPAGIKLDKLREALEELEARPSDVVFLDYSSLWQDAACGLPALYHAVNPDAEVVYDTPNSISLPGRTKDQVISFRFSLFEATRIYAFGGGVLPSGEQVLGCKVLVLPDLEEPTLFPASSEPRTQTNWFCDPPREELWTSWGFSKSIPYERGGWTCAEYAVARMSGTIANMHHDAVQVVEKSRRWPTNVSEYSAMMEEDAENPVAFTRKGDREAVRFNFYKYTHAFDSEYASVDRCTPANA